MRKSFIFTTKSRIVVNKEPLSRIFFMEVYIWRNSPSVKLCLHPFQTSSLTSKPVLGHGRSDVATGRPCASLSGPVGEPAEGLHWNCSPLAG